jgi:hypothetical protein
MRFEAFRTEQASNRQIERLTKWPITANR